MTRRVSLIGLVVLFVASAAFADGLIVPIRHDIRVSGSWAVKYHNVDIKVRDQVANVTVDQAFTNTGGGMIEVEYLFPLPPQAAIDALTLVVDGKEFAGKVLPADEARRTYESIVRTKKDPALLEYVNYGLYKTSAFPLQPGKDVRVVVHYTDVCKRDHNLVEVFYPLNTEKFSAKPIDEVNIKVDVEAKGPIAAVYSPTHDLTVKRPDSMHAIATYSVKKDTPATDFRLLYQPTGEAVGATVLSYRPRETEDGYFLLMVSPTPQKDGAAKAAPKDIVVLLDRSGSMSGGKLDQAKESLQYVLKNLNAGDRFNVVVYSDSIDPMFDSLVAADDKHVADAGKMLDRLDPRGGTAINDALAAGLKMFKADTVEERVNRSKYLLFLTDGQPTIGNTNQEDILKNTVKLSNGKVRIFAMGIGYDVNTRLLDRLVADNRGVSEYVKEKEPLEAKLSNLYAKIKNPVMTDLAVTMPGTKISTCYPQVMPDLFDGGQIVMVGRYEKPGATNVLIKGNYLGKSQTFEYTADLAAKSDKFSYTFVEQIWAVRRVGFLMDQIQLHGKSNEVVEELIKLSKQYGIITPYTSFLADERVNLADAGEVRRHAEEMAKGLAAESSVVGSDGQMSAKSRGSLNTQAQAPSAGAGKMFGNTTVAKYEANEQEKVASVQNAGNRAFFRRDKQWVESSLADKDQAKLNKDAKEVRQFSQEYFDIVARNSMQENQILASQRAGEELVVSLRGEVYRFTSEH